MDFYGIVSLLALLLSAALIVRALASRGPAEVALTFFLALVGQILLVGYVASALERLAATTLWATLSCGSLLIAALLVLVIAPARKAALRKVEITSGPRAIWNGFRELPGFFKALLLLLGLTALVVALANLAVALFTAPHNWDSMTYHLARMAFYLQQGSLKSFTANYWAQVIHPKNSTLLVTWTYLISGRNENLTQLVQYAAWWISALAVYGIGLRLGAKKHAALIAALIFSLLTEVLMESVTTQNDLLLTACVGCVTYFLLSYRQRPRLRYLALAAVAAAIALGMKSSMALVLPSLAIVALYALSPKREGVASPTGDLGRSLVQLLGLGLVACALFTLPAGYLENWRLYGHPIGPQEVRDLHAFGDADLTYVLEHGTKNLLRYTFEFISLDGLPNEEPIHQVQAALRKWPREGVELLGWDLEDREATRAPFYYGKMPHAHEDGSYWGIFGFGLLWIVVWLAMFGVLRNPGGRALALASVVFLLAQSYAGPYDPWRGRYFIIVAVLAAPVLAPALSERPSLLVRTYLVAVVLVGCATAICAVGWRRNSTLLPTPSTPLGWVFKLDRTGQLTRNRPNYRAPIRRFDAAVPDEAIVATWLGGDQFEYPLFGEGLTRTIIPIYNGQDKPYPVPDEAQYLLYRNGYRYARGADSPMGEDWFLRRIGQ